MATDVTAEVARAAASGARMPREARRVQILRAAAGAFLHEGFDGTSMEDVARAAGVTRLIVYRIFDNKEQLYTAVLNDVLTRLDADFNAYTHADPMQRETIAHLLLGVARAHPDGFRLLWRHAAHEPQFAHIANGLREVAEQYADTIIHTLVHDRTLRRWTARAIVSHLYDGICSWLDAGDPALDEQFATILGNGSRALVAACAETSATP